MYAHVIHTVHMSTAMKSRTEARKEGSSQISADNTSQLYFMLISEPASGACCMTTYQTRENGDNVNLSVQLLWSLYRVALCKNRPSNR